MLSFYSKFLVKLSKLFVDISDMTPQKLSKAQASKVRETSSSSSSNNSSPPTRRYSPSPNRSGARRRSSQPVDMSGELAEFVKKAISNDEVVIFSKTYCPYCTMAKKVFDKMEKPYTVIELDKRNDGSSIQGILKEITGASTVPRVFLNGECIGGGTDVQALYESGQLQNMIVKTQEKKSESKKENERRSEKDSKPDNTKKT